MIKKLKRWLSESAPFVSRKRYETEIRDLKNTLARERMYNEVANRSIQSLKKELYDMVPKFPIPKVNTEIEELQDVISPTKTLHMRLTPITMSVRVDLLGYDQFREHALDALKSRAVDGWSLAAEKSIENAIREFNKKENK